MTVPVLASQRRDAVIAFHPAERSVIPGVPNGIDRELRILYFGLLQAQDVGLMLLAANRARWAVSAGSSLRYRSRSSWPGYNSHIHPWTLRAASFSRPPASDSRLATTRAGREAAELSSSSSSTIRDSPTFGPSANPRIRRRTWSGWRRRAASSTNFYVPQAICSASRSALMSGCYPGPDEGVRRASAAGAGLDPKFATMGEVLKARGLQDGGVRQVAPRRSARNASAGAGIRRVVRTDVLERHVGVPSRESRRVSRVPAPVLGERQDQDRARDAASISRC